MLETFFSIIFWTGFQDKLLFLIQYLAHLMEATCNNELTKLKLTKFWLHHPQTASSRKSRSSIEVSQYNHHV